MIKTNKKLNKFICINYIIQIYLDICRNDKFKISKNYKSLFYELYEKYKE